MRGIGFYFFVFGALCVTAGMGWGIEMAISGDHRLAGAHAHLNLVGWVTMGLFGIYYTLTPRAAASGLAKIHLALAVAGVVVMVPGIAIAIQGGTEALAAAGSMLTAASMLVFLYTLFRNGLGQPA
ncbi:MAG: signal peptide protein [Hoeflea sp. BRH_c9]|nr:MAG: signal peptide protein [Hoeflea sp. BRH_c9]